MSDSSIENNQPLPKGRRRSRTKAKAIEGAVTTSLGLCGVFSVLVTFSIIFVLFEQTFRFFGVHGDDTPGRTNPSCARSSATIEPSAIEISEVRLHVPLESPGETDLEYFELHAPPGTPLDGLSYVVIGAPDSKERTSDSGVVRTVVDLSGHRVPSSGYFVTSSRKKAYDHRADLVTLLDFSDTDNNTHMLVRGLVAKVGDDLDADNDGHFDSTPWAELVDSLALIEDPHPTPENNFQKFYSEDAVGPTGPYTPTHVYRCADTDEWRIGSIASVYVTPTEFFTGRQWNPLLGAVKHFGIWPLVSGTLMVTIVAMLVTVPFGLVTAVFLSEYAPRRLRAILKPALEVLAGIPTVVYGYFALTVITPWLQARQQFVSSIVADWTWLPDGIHAFLTHNVEVYNVMSAGIAVGIMALPIVCSLSEDALAAVPRSLREGAFATGATKFEVSTRVVVPAALSGIVASFLLAIARAFGETMIVALAAGNLAQITLDPRESSQTMTAWIVQIFLGDASNFGPEYLSCYAVASMLFVMTLVLTLTGGWILKRFREVYE